MSTQDQPLNPHVRHGTFKRYSEPGWNRDAWRDRRARALGLDPLPAPLVRQRLAIPPAPLHSFAGSFYWPCEVRVAENVWVDHVCLVRARDWFGPWPHESDGPYLDVCQLLEIRESPSRLPAPFISQAEVKAQGLGFNGAMIELIYRDGSTTIVGGEFFEFPPYPEDKGPADVVGIATPNKNRMSEALFPARPIWCVVY